MRFRVLKNLFLNNLLYANPMVTDQNRKKISNTPIGVRLFKSQLLANLVLTLMLIVGVFSIDFSQHYARELFILMLFSFIILLDPILNVLYDSEDITSIIALPIKQSELILSKLLVIFFSSLTPILFFIIVTLKISMYDQQFNFIRLIIVIIYIIAVTIIIYSTIILSIGSLARTKLFIKNKNKVRMVLSLLSFISIFMPYSNTKIEFLNDISNRFNNFFNSIIVDELGYLGLLNLAIIIIISCTLVYILNRNVVDNYFDLMYRLQNKKIVKNKKLKQNGTKVKQDLSINRLLFKNNINYFKDGKLFNMYLTSSIFGLMLIVPLVINITRYGKNDYYSDFRVLAMYILIGSIFGVFSSFYSTIAVSIEKDNYLHLKSLPIKFGNYLKIKLLAATITSFILPFVFLIVLGLYIGAPFQATISAIFGCVVVGTAENFRGFIKDYRNPYFNWNNALELVNKNTKSKILQIVLVFILLIVFYGLIIITALIIDYSYTLSLLLAGIYSILGIIYLILMFYRLNKFVLKENN